MLFLRRYFSLYIPFLESCKVVCRSKDVEEFFAYNSAANVACSDSWKLLFALAFYSCFLIFFLSWEEFMRWTIISDGFLISWSHGTLLVESKLSSYLRTWPLYSTSLLGCILRGLTVWIPVHCMVGGLYLSLVFQTHRLQWNH